MSTPSRVSRTSVDRFLAERRLALVGASRGGRKFGNTLLRELGARGYDVIPVHPQASLIAGLECANEIAEIDPPPGGVVVCVPPDRAIGVVEEAAAAGVRRVWLQQGSESEAVIRRCDALELEAVHGECLLMFVEPTGFVHRAHRFVNQLLGRLPA